MTEQYQCKSYSDDNHVVQDCTCGKCGESWEEKLDIAIANLLFAGLSIAQMEKIPKWMLENVEKNKSKFKQALLTQSKAQEERFVKQLRDWFEETFHWKSMDTVYVTESELEDFIKALTNPTIKGNNT